MLAPRSQVEKALRDTLITKAEGESLRLLGRFYNLARPTAAFSDPAWRKALRAIVFGPRGTLGGTHDFLEGLFSDFATQWSVALDPVTPRRVQHVSGPSAGFTACHVGRLCRIKFIPASAAGFDSSLPESLWPWAERIFFSVGPNISALPATSSYLELAPFDSGYWTGADWAAGAWAVDPANTGATMSVLSFVYLEPSPGPMTDDTAETRTAAGSACQFQLLLDDTISLTPPTYLLDPAGVDRDSIDVGMPDGGHIMDLFDLDDDVSSPPPHGDPLGVGPHPLYFQEGVGGFAVNGLLDLLLAAGVRAVERVHSFCTG